MVLLNSIRTTLTNIRIVGGLNSRKPKLLKRVLKGFINARCKGNISLRFMDIALSYSCNFSCLHCSAEALKKTGVDTLSIKEYSRVAQDAMAAGVLVFHFTGGEPILQPKLFEIIAAFKPEENLISIQTNGWLVDEKFIRGYKAAGGDILCVSLDSVTADAHDEFRKTRGSWHRAVEAVTLAKKAGLRVLISYTLTHANIRSDDFIEMIKFSRRLGAVLSLNLAVPAGKWKGNRDLLLNGDDRILLNDLLRKNPHLRTDFESNWRVRGCPAFKEKCYLSPYGDVLPCPFIHISFGNIRSKSLSLIRAAALGHMYFQKYHPVCIAAEDKYFIEHAGCYGIDSELLPISAADSELFNQPGV
ncbi:MAG: radical SAM protein [Candidatus Omnitrophota bacterium]